MTYHEYTTAKYYLLHVANVLAPNSKVQQAYSALVFEMESNAESFSDTIQALLDHISNGLRYGNYIGLSHMGLPVK